MLRLNQNVAPIFYLPHLLADAAGLFQAADVEVEIVTSGHRMQWTALSTRSADVTVGGAMRTLKLHHEGKSVINFALCVHRSPVVLVASPNSSFSWPELVRRGFIDDGEIETGELCMRWLLRKHGVDPDTVPGLRPRDRGEGRQWFLQNRAPFLLQPLESVIDLIRSNRAGVVVDLATDLGTIPWSTYSMLPTTLVEKRSEVEAFLRALSESLRMIREGSPADLANAASSRFPNLEPVVVEAAIASYRAAGVWPHEPFIDETSFDHYQTILVSAGWVPDSVPYTRQVARL